MTGHESPIKEKLNSNNCFQLFVILFHFHSLFAENILNAQTNVIHDDNYFKVTFTIIPKVITKN